MDNKPVIYPFRTPGGYYVFDVNTNRILAVKKSVYEILNNTDTGEEQSEELIFIEKMKANGFLSSNMAAEIVHPADEVLPDYLNHKIRSITLQVTQQCNLRCKYCVYSGGYSNRAHSNQKMGFETAKKGVDFLISHSRDIKTVNIGFYGGEPLLEFDLIKKCIDYALEIAEGKEITFSLTTNATLLTREIIEYLNIHNINLLISLDGPKEIHDKNRKFVGNNSGTFYKVMENLEKIRETCPEYFCKIGFSIVLDPENSFSCIDEFFMSYETVKEARKSATLITNKYLQEKINSNELFFDKMNYETFKMFLYKLERLEKKYVSDIAMQHYDNLKRYMHVLRTPTQKLPQRIHHSGPCIPGAQRLFMNVNGDLLPCERVSESSEMMKIGDIDTGFDMERCKQLLNIGKISEENCKNCWAVKFCTLCAVAADNLKTLSKEKKLSCCKSIKTDTENLLQDYCMLKEYGYDFEENVELWV